MHEDHATNNTYRVKCVVLCVASARLARNLGKTVPCVGKFVPSRRAIILVKRRSADICWLSGVPLTFSVCVRSGAPLSGVPLEFVSEAAPRLHLASAAPVYSGTPLAYSRLSH